jgi:signal transduction histidine kinase
LKTPVTTLKAFTQLLQRNFRKQGEEIPLTYLAKMDAQINKLTRLIADLLDVSKVQQNKIQYTFQEFNLEELTREVIEDNQDTYPSHSFIMKGDFNKEMYGDKDRISQVFTNLLSNAVKYSPSTSKILVEAMNDKKEIIISVQDFGIGILLRHHERLFEKFYRVEDSNQRNQFPGLGIGLYISSEIIKRHGGRMWVKSDIGKGSTFYFSLPLNNKPVSEK